MKRKRKTEFSERIMKNNLMQRFIREIEREDALDENTLEMMLAYQHVKIR